MNSTDLTVRPAFPQLDSSHISIHRTPLPLHLSPRAAQLLNHGCAWWAGPEQRLTTVLARFGWLGEPLWKGCSNCFTGGVTSCRRRLELLIEAVVWIYERLKYNSEDKKILIVHPLIHPRYTHPVDLHIGTGLGPLFSPLTWWLQVGITTFCFLSLGNQLKQKLQRINCIFCFIFP